MNIVICDDNTVYLKSFSNTLESMLEKNSIKGKITYSSDNLENLQHFVKQNPVDVFFLDIDMNSKETGLDFAIKLRQNYKNIYIVFITEMLQYVFQAFQAHPFQFLPKPVTEKMLEQCLIDIWEDMKSKSVQSDETINIKSGSVVFMVKPSEIIFIEKIGNKCIIHLLKGIIECYETLETFEEKLCQNKDFIRCHKSYIANLVHITEVRLSDMELVFTNDSKCYIGRKYKTDLLRRTFI